MPALRERSGDIPALVRHFLADLRRSQGVELSLDDRALAALQCYPWPGNVRELANLMERLAILYPDDRVGVQELPARFRADVGTDVFAAPRGLEAGAPAVNGEVPEKVPGEDPGLVAQFQLPAAGTTLDGDGLDLRAHLAELERDLLQQALERSDWVVSRAAKLLNLQRTTLVEKLRKHGIERPLPTSDP
jgi:sigma-54 specific flagellar transcriptional regulator A